MTKEQKYQVEEAEKYAPPKMETIPLRGSGMLCLSAGAQYVQDDKVLLDFFSEGDAETAGNLNSQFGTWSDEGGSSFF